MFLVTYTAYCTNCHAPLLLLRISVSIVTFTGPIYAIMANRAVQVNPQNEVVLSADDQGATAFMLVKCRAWNFVSEVLRSRCFSLVAANTDAWYVRHRRFLLCVEPKPDSDLHLYDLDSSFIVHKDTFYDFNHGYYSLESVNFPNYYVQSLDDGRLGITQRADTAAYSRTASFENSAYSTSGN